MWQITTWASATETKRRKIHTYVFRLYFVVEEFQTYDRGINLLNSVERCTLICPDIGPHEPHHPAHVNEIWSPSAERLKSSTAVWKEWGSLPNSIYNQINRNSSHVLTNFRGKSWPQFYNKTIMITFYRTRKY